MPYNYILFVLKRITWNSNCLLRIIVIYLKPYNCVQTNYNYWIEIITWNYQAIGLMSRVFANGPGDCSSIPGWVIPKTQKNATWYCLA